jgi:hypothetical protein
MAREAEVSSCSTGRDEPCGAVPVTHDDATSERGCVSATRVAVAPIEHVQTPENEANTIQARRIGHDLNNVLAVITTYTLLVLEVLEADDPSRRDLEEVCGAAERATHLARELSMLGRQSDSVARPF